MAEKRTRTRAGLATANMTSPPKPIKKLRKEPFRWTDALVDLLKQAYKEVGPNLRKLKQKMAKYQVPDTATRNKLSSREFREWRQTEGNSISLLFCDNICILVGILMLGQLFIIPK